MRFLFLGIILLMLGSVIFGGIFLSHASSSIAELNLLSIISMGSCLIVGGIFVFFGLGNEKNKAQKDIIADIESEGLLVSIAIIERVNKS